MHARNLFARAASICLLSALLPATLRGDGLIRDGIGAISSGRGGTNQGFSDNGAILLDNPAAMVNVKGRGLTDVGVDTLITDIHYTDRDPNDVYAKVRPFPAPTLAYISKSDDDRWAWGIGAFAPAGFGASYNMQNPQLGPQVYRSFGMLGKVLPGLSYRVNDKLSIGGTLGLAFTHIELDGPYYLQSGALAGVPTVMDLQSTGVAGTGSVALQYIATPDTVLGLTYTEQSKFHAHGNVFADVYGLGPAPISSRFDTQMNITWPRSLAAGLKHDWNSAHTSGVDVIWYNWHSSFNRLDLSLTNSSNPIFPALLGPRINDSLPLNWRDTVSLRLGHQWQQSDRNTFRAGYVYHASPVPNSTLNPYTDGVLEHAFSAGYSRRLRRCQLNTAYQYSFSPVRSVGTSALAGGDFSNSTFSAQAHWISIGLLFPF